MTRLSVAEAQQQAGHLANVQGWLEDDDPFFSTIDEIVEARHKHLPRVLRGKNPVEQRSPGYQGFS